MEKESIPEMLIRLEEMNRLAANENGCVPPPKPEKKYLNPVLDHLKQSTFQPDIKSFITLDAKYRQDKSYSMELNAKYIDSEMEIFLCSGHGSAEEVRKYLKSLNELTADMLEFMDQHHIRTAVE